MFRLSIPADARHREFAIAEHSCRAALIFQGGQLPPHDLTLAFVPKRKLDRRANVFACWRAVKGFFAD